MSEVVTLGECLVTLVAERPGPLADATSFHRFVAGAEANVAVGLVRLGHAVTYIGRVGDDGFGAAIRRQLRGEGVDTSFLATDPGAPNGVMIRERPGLVPAQVLYYRRGSAGSRVSATDVDEAERAGAFVDARWIHLTGITPALSADACAAVERAIAVGRDAGATISLDINLRRRLWSDEAAAPVLRDLAGRVDVLLGSADELAVLAGRPIDGDDDPSELARATLDLGPTIAVAKLGAAGARAVERGATDAVHRDAVPLTSVVDPVGAGDAFCAGFIAARLEGRGLSEALDDANACGAAVASALGDQGGLPDRAAVDAIHGSTRRGTGPDTVR
jgi:2-dehydro-3-deoxygluconokinase